MWLVHFVLSSLLLRLPAVNGRAAPAPAPIGRQVPHPEIPNLSFPSLAARDPQSPAAPAVSSPSTLTTVTSISISTSSPIHEVSPLTALPRTSTPPPASPTPSGSRNHNIVVAQNSSTFTPSTLRNIPAGDTLTFYFYPSNYSVVQSAFDKPCQPLSLSSGGASAHGVFSGFHPTEDAQGISREKFVVTVTGIEPLWIYGVDGGLLSAALTNSEAGKESACARGMSLVVNPPPKDFSGGSGETLSAYRRNAANADLNGSKAGGNAMRVPESIEGGEVRGVSEKEKQRWEGKHPLGGGNGQHTGNGTSAGDGILKFENAASVVKKESLVRIVGLVGVLMGSFVLVAEL